MTGFRAGRERVRTVRGHGRHWRGHHHTGGRGGRGAAAAAAAVVMRHVIMVFRARPGQAVCVLVVGERVLVARRHHDHGPGQVRRLRLVEVITAAVPRPAFQRVGLLLLVREEFRLEIYGRTLNNGTKTNNEYTYIYFVKLTFYCGQFGFHRFPRQTV